MKIHSANPKGMPDAYSMAYFSVGIDRYTNCFVAGAYGPN